MSKSDFVWEEEASFHNKWAAETSLENRLVHESFEAFLALEGKYAMSCLPDIRGKKVLDVGSGLGEAGTYFALQGANVTITDVSPNMIESAKQLAVYHNVTLTGIVCPVEELDLPADSFDFCYSANLLHHVTDHEQVIVNLKRVLKPGGSLITWDPLAYNPMINIYRRITRGKVRTIDEEPLKFDILKLFQKHFPTIEHKEFWFLSNAVFLKYLLIDGLNPNKVRYWKHILHEQSENVRWLKPLLTIDDKLLRHRLFQYFAWTILIHARKE
jgi:ubiquinone/menaquinone biosynthesis C-methylase UbiE